MEWIDAREQCWRWGGELALPLPKADCSSPTYMFKREEVRIPGPDSQIIITQIFHFLRNLNV